MKVSRVMLSLVLIGMMAIGWTMLFVSNAEEKAQIASYMVSGDDYMQKCLYQKAIMAYENTLSHEETKEARDKWIQAYQASYEDGTATKKQYKNALIAAAQIYTEDMSYWEKAIALDLDQNNYVGAYATYKEASKAEARSELLYEYEKRILYSYTVGHRGYKQFSRNLQGYYTVYDGMGWGVLNPNGTNMYDCIYTYISPLDSSLNGVFCSKEKGARFMDKKGVIHFHLPNEYEKALAYASGYVPVYVEDAWHFLECKTGNIGETGYEQVTVFSNNVAFVKQNQTWMLIDIQGNKVSEQVFDDVKCYGNGMYTANDIIVASQNGKYGFYNSVGESRNAFTCKDADVYYGSAVAYQDESGKWGFVSVDGDIVIKPAFKKAKSFSGGLAAVYNGEKWGFINQKGELVIDYQFVDADYFTTQGACMVSTYEGSYQMLSLRF